MEITQIRFEFNEESRPGIGELLAFASIELEGCLVVKRIRVVGYQDGRVSVFMPCRKVNDRFEDVVYASSQALRSQFASEILSKLGRELEELGEDEKSAKVKAGLAKLNG